VETSGEYPPMMCDIFMDITYNFDIYLNLSVL